MPRHRFRAAPESDTLTSARTQHLPPSSVNARRSHSTDRILDIITDYKLSPMPFIPYALTLALSVAYRKWRFSQLPMFRTRGGADFKKVLPPLQEMGAIWTSARINGQLGQAVMLKLDRSELLTRRSANKTATAGQPRVLPGDRHQAQVRDANDSRDNNDGQPARVDMAPPSTPPPDAPSGSSMPVEASQNSQTTTTVNNSAGPAPGLPKAFPPTTTVQPPPGQPLTWASTTTWTADPNPPPPAHNPTQTDIDDPLPIPGTFLPNAFQHTGFADPWPASGNMDEFLADDDVLFRAWDPGFAQSVDFSFSSILDPGNPFAWPEYCGGSYVA